MKIIYANKLLLLALFLNALGNSLQAIEKKYKIGLCIMATGKYIQFVKPLIDSAEKYFCKNHVVNFFVFTDSDLPCENNIIKLYQKRLGWPYDTMMRFAVYNKYEESLSKMDYLFSCDADMLFVNSVGDEILSDLVATQHPGFVNNDRQYTYERNSLSKAFISNSEGHCYFAGGFYGGSKKEFLKLVRANMNNIDYDLKNNYIAIWHDESHLNRYFIDNKPTLILSPSYCYPERATMPYEKKLLALDKNHATMRQ